MARKHTARDLEIPAIGVETGTDVAENEDPDPLFEIRLGQRSPMEVMSNAAITLERVRVGAQVRLTHLAKRGGTCPYTIELLQRARQFEEWADTSLARLVRTHPTAYWITRVKGTGGEAIGKVLGHIDNFGRFYEEGDPMIPSYVNRPAVEADGKRLIWVEGIERFPTPSKLHKYAGLVQGMKREPGKPLGYNDELKSMLFRLGTSLLKAKGKFYEFYLSYKRHLLARLSRDGVSVLPTPMSRFCATCRKEVKLKSARFCPDCGSPLSKKEEPENILWEGHVHMMCMRRMIKALPRLLLGSVSGGKRFASARALCD